MKELYLKKSQTWAPRKEAKAGSVIQESKSCEECDDHSQDTGNFALDVYKDHLRNRQIVISGVIDETMVEKVTLQLLKFNEQDDDREAVDRTFDRRNSPITIKMATVGGFVDVGLGIISQIVQSETPIIGYAIGDCSSMGALIMASCHVRFISQYSRIMIHSLGSGVVGKLYDIFDKADELAKLQKTMDDILTSRTLITQKKLDELHAVKGDWYLNAEEAKALAVVDEIVSVGLKLTHPRKRKPVAKEAKKKL